ncbi:MAG: HAMP domain-containing histidine kinase [Propionibacteriaceae bacterium]|jgi:signal transduction histidine kinase|nr:HAMP domain-containing histidine kinase [Propionibacteriaceae bacterium]
MRRSRAIRDSYQQLSDELDSARQAAEQLEQRKNRLLMDLSHDIKTPMSTILACAKALESGMVPEDKRQAYFAAIDAKGHQVLRLADDLVVVMSMQSADFAIVKQPLDAAELLRTVCVARLDEVENRGLTLDVDIPEDPQIINADRNLMGRVLENLLANAIKYNTTGLQIRTSLTPLPDGLLFVVADDGNAIPEAHRAAIFDVFVRVDQARATEGSGLGLSICKGIVDRHQGRIDYLRTAHWNEFRVFLPTDSASNGS